VCNRRFQKPVAELLGSVVELPQLEPFLKFTRFLDDILRRPDCLASNFSAERAVATCSLLPRRSVELATFI
jgi:hypothetical protein